MKDWAVAIITLILFDFFNMYDKIYKVLELRSVLFILMYFATTIKYTRLVTFFCFLNKWFLS